MDLLIRIRSSQFLPTSILNIYTESGHIEIKYEIVILFNIILADYPDDYDDEVDNVVAALVAIHLGFGDNQGGYTFNKLYLSL